MTKLEQILEGLTAEQQEAVRAEPVGNLRITAGAGSGKTEVLTRRVVSLFEQGVSPAETVAITYTTKAAAEMKERLVERQRLSPSQIRHMQISTFHSFLKSFLGQDPFGAGLDSRTEVVSSIFQRLLVQELVDKFAEMFGDRVVDGHDGLGQHAQRLVSAFGDALLSVRRFILTPAEFYQLSRQRFQEREDLEVPATELEKRTLEWLFRFYSLYVEELNKGSMLDFDEIFIRGRGLLREMRSQGATPKQRAFLIDEFQDNNQEQFAIVQEFCADRESHICVVGDEKQSIYSFQGADVQTFRSFPAHKDVVLRDNFRSYAEIIAFADSFLEKGGEVGELFAKQVARRGFSPDKPAVSCFLHRLEDKDALFVEVVRMVHELVSGGLEIECRRSGQRRAITYGDVAIVVNSVNNDLPSSFEDELERFQIPYALSGGYGFYGKSEIKEILSFLHLLVDSEDNHSVVKILTGPLYGLNDSEVVQLFLDGRASNLSMLAHILAKNEAELPQNACEFRKLFVKLKGMSNNFGLLDLCYVILEEAGFNEYAASQTSFLRRIRMQNNLTKFLGAVRAFEQNGVYTTIRDFLVYVEQILNVGDDEEAGLGLEDKDVLKVMTIHKSKGLEFPVVICPTLSERTFRFVGNIKFNRELGLMVNVDEEGSPIHERFREMEKETALSENRRKYYVAFTRAENRLILLGKNPAELEERAEPEETKASSRARKPKPDPVMETVCEVLQESPEIGALYDLEDWETAVNGWLPQRAEEPAVGEEVEEAEATEATQEPIISQEEVSTQEVTSSEEILALGRDIKSIVDYLSTQHSTPTGVAKPETAFSLQDLSSFERCPRRYYLTKQHTKGFAEREINLFAVAGTMFHETVRLYHGFGHEALPIEEATQKALDMVKALVGSYGKEGESVFKRVCGLVRRYVPSELGRTAPWRIEAEVNVKLEGEKDEPPFFVRGFADRIDRYANGELRIIDYKTRAYSQKTHEGYAKQLALYRLAAQRGVLGDTGCLNIASSYIAYITQDEIKLVELEPDLVGFEAEVKGTINRLRGEAVWAPVCSEECAECGFNVFCNLAEVEEKFG